MKLSKRLAIMGVFAVMVLVSGATWGFARDGTVHGSSASVAGLSGYEVVTESTGSDSSSVKSVTAQCPPGKMVIGGGARIFGSISGTALTTSGPEGPPSEPTEWFATALEVAPNSQDWGLRVDVFCATVPDYEVITQSTGSDSSSVKSMTAACPPGKMVIGGGARIFGSISGTALTTNGPEGPPSQPTEWFATALEVTPNNQDWGLRVDVFCATVPDYEVVTQSTGSDSSSVKSMTAECPAGKMVIGGGARIFGSISGTALTTSGPEGPPSQPAEWFATALEVAPNSQDWGLRVDVFCASEVQKVYLPIVLRSS